MKWLVPAGTGLFVMLTSAVMALSFALFEPKTPLTSPQGLTCLTLAGAGFSAAVIGIIREWGR